MARTLTAAAQTQANRRDGAEPVYILEVAFESGTRFWSGRTLATPVSAEARIVSWGELQLTATPGQAGGVGTMTLEIADHDHFLKGEAEAQPGYQNVDATLYLWFRGTTWPDDRITLFAGVLTAPCEWDEARAVTRVTMKGREHKHDKNLGIVMSHAVFPEIDCKACENELLPIVYGNPCARIPCCVIDRPGVAQLAATLTSLPPSTTLTIDQGAAAANFTEGVSIELVVGWGGRWERITGSFASSDDTTFSITSRGSILADGDISLFGAGGMTYITVPKSELPDAGAASRAGCPILLKQQDNSWVGLMMTHWWESGSHIIVAIRGDDIDVVEGSDFQILIEPGVIPEWPIGTQVSEAAIVGTSQGGGTWTYAVNMLPSKSVDSVEVRARVNVAGGDSHVKWATLNPAYYSVSLNDTSYNGNLGRDPGDPGITTVTLDFSPASLGMDDETIWCTVKGITNDNTATGTVLEDPSDVIQNLLTNEFIGGLATSLIDTTSFTAAASSIVTRCGFAILDEKRKLIEVCSEIAHQANCVLFVDGGKFTLKYLDPVIGADTSQMTVTNANRRRASLKIAEIDIKEYVTELTGRFRRTIADDDQRIVRGSVAHRSDTSGDASSAGGNAAQTDFGVHRDEIEFWAYQFPTSVAKATENWLRYYLTTNRLATVDLFLDALKLQPGDTITLTITDGNGTTVFGGEPARIRSVRMRLGNATRREMPQITAVCEVSLFDYGITVIVPSDDNCAGQNVSGGRSRSQALALRATGAARSLYAIDVRSPQYGVGASGGANAEDPTADEELGVTPPRLGTADMAASISSFS